MPNNNTQGTDTTTTTTNTPLLNPEIDDESPIMFRRRRADEEAQDNNHPNHQPNGPRPKGPAWRGEYAKSIVYGGLDAIVTSFSLISSISAAGGRLSSVDVLVLGFANLIADGISMGFGDYVSSSTEKNMAVMEEDVTRWEVENHRGSKIGLLVRRYRDLGMDPRDASTVVNIFSKYKHIMVEEEMMGQKGILPPDQDGHKPWKSGLVTFAAFVLFGSAPLLSFIILIPFTDNDNVKFAGACVLSGLALGLLGLAKARLSGEGYGLSALVTLFNGAVAAGVAYSIGWTLRNVAGLEEP